MTANLVPSATRAIKGATEIEAFLTHLAVAGKVSASSRNRAKSSLLFLYRLVLGIDFSAERGVTQREGAGLEFRLMYKF
ncbi:MAG: phage integrase N-terminal SAM-like domain-containing protein [Porticoccaceae bacterium]